MRSREEIEKKIEQYGENKRMLNRRLGRLDMLFKAVVLAWLVVVAVVLIAVASDWIAGGESTVLGLVIFIGVPIGIVIVDVVWSRKKEKLLLRRQAIVAGLAEVLKVLSRPAGDQVLLNILDKMIITQAGKKKQTVSLDKMTYQAKLDRVFEDARLEAFSWTASPGGVQEKREL